MKLHCRLIDADALRAQFPEPDDWSDRDKALIHITGVWAVIDTAPTIIDASYGEQGKPISEDILH